MADVKSKCKICGSTLSCDEIGIYKKMINRGAVECMCLKCLSREIGVSEDALRERIEHFRRMGCTLFV